MAGQNGGIQICFANSRNVTKGFRTLLHQHEWWQYLLIARGSVMTRVDQEYALLSDGAAAMIPGDTIHRFYASADTRMAEVKFYLDDESLAQQLIAAGPFVTDVGARIPSTVDALIHEGVESLPFYNELATQFVIQLIYLHLRQASLSHEPPRELPRPFTRHLDLRDISKPVVVQKCSASVTKIIEYIESHHQEALTLEELAERFGYTRSYLCEMFASVVKTSPMRYLNLVRLDRAKELLATSSLSVAEIGATVGFGSTSQFWRMCRSETGMSPREFRLKYVQDHATYIRFMEHWQDFAPIH